jgi:hypothetical protein
VVSDGTTFVPVPGLSALVSAAQNGPQYLHSAQKYWSGEAGKERKAATYMMLDQAYLNDSKPSKDALDALYGKEVSQKLGEEWQKVHAHQQSMDGKVDPPLGSSSLWKDQANMTYVYGKVRPIVGPASGGKISPPTKIDWKADPAILNRPNQPKPPRVQTRPFSDYPDDVIKDELGPGAVPPRSTAGKVWSSVKGKIPFVSTGGPPDGKIVNGVGTLIDTKGGPHVKVKIKPTPGQTPIEPPPASPVSPVSPISPTPPQLPPIRPVSPFDVTPPPTPATPTPSEVGSPLHAHAPLTVTIPDGPASAAPPASR